MHKKIAVFAATFLLAAGAGASGQDDQAIKLLEQAVQVHPDDASLHSQLARHYARVAENSYRKALSIDPLDVAAIGGLIDLYRHQGMSSKVQLTVAQLTPAQRSALGSSLRQIEASMLRDQADLRLEKGEIDRAIKYLEQAVKVDADDPWLHFELAKLHQRQNDPASGLALLGELLARHPDDPASLHAMALFQSDLGDSSNALKTLNRIDASLLSPDMVLLQQRLTIVNLEQDAKSLMQAGKKSDAIKKLSDAEALGSGNENLTLSVALAWAEIGEVERGRALFAKVRNTPPSVNWHLRYANFLAVIDSNQELHDELELIAGIPSLSPAEKKSLAELQESAAIRMADKHVSAGNAALAHQALAPQMKQKPDQVRLLLADARVYMAEHHWQAAQDIYTRILKTDPVNKDARSGLIAVLVASGKRTEALQQLDAWAADRAANDIPAGLQLSGMFNELGEYARAKKVMDTLISTHPDASYVLNDAWKMAQQAGQLDDETGYLKKLVIAEPYVRPGASPKEITPQADSGPAVADENTGIGEFGSPEKIQRDWKEKKLAALIDRRSRWFSFAIDTRNRSGTPGLSQMNSVEVPLEFKTPWHANDEVFFRTDLVKLNAGDVDPTSSRFGSMQFCQPTCASASLHQAAQGMSFTAGYQRDEFNADIGFTPRNFPVSNVVGGIRRKGDLGEYGYSLEASRRPVTSSYLSFAGTEDPNSGKVWGGVVATGARLGLSLDKGETFGFWSSLGLHSLTGRNVQSNRRLQIMAGEQWRAINEENRRLVFGLTGMYWNFAENAGEYTFGHGGYYSPQKYLSLALPITYTARSSRFSYMLRGAVSASHTHMQDAPYFPADSAMQLAAGSPIYTGGPSNGTGFSLSAACEYQVKPKLFAGGLLSIDRSEYYAPNRALIYLRYSFDHAGAQPVFMPPEPVEPSSQF